MLHRTVPIKVTAWVDERIAPLVAALNRYPQVVTLDSCEGHGGEGGAYVLFTCEGEDPAEFASELGKALSLEPVDYLLRAEWRAEQAEPLLELACTTERIDALAAAVTAAHTRRCACDTSGTAPRS